MHSGEGSRAGSEVEMRAAGGEARETIVAKRGGGNRGDRYSREGRGKSPSQRRMKEGGESEREDENNDETTEGEGRDDGAKDNEMLRMTAVEGEGREAKAENDDPEAENDGRGRGRRGRRGGRGFDSVKEGDGQRTEREVRARLQRH
ncbi:hypothetical protein ACLOJK_016143 [Asimina triloba]